MSVTGIGAMSPEMAKLQARAGQDVTGAIRLASTETGVDFAYLMSKAAAESNFDPEAEARTSSATGLYQFLDSTWMEMVEKYGAKHGLGDMRAAPKGEILALRRDPEMAARMAAEFAAQNKRVLEQNLPHREIGNTDLYMAHFLGAGGASEFLKQMEENPFQSGALRFPEAARANRNVFFDSQGRARNLGEIHQFFSRKFETIETQAAGTPIAEKPARAETSMSPVRAGALPPNRIDPQARYMAEIMLSRMNDLISERGTARTSALEIQTLQSLSGIERSFLEMAL